MPTPAPKPPGSPPDNAGAVAVGLLVVGFVFLLLVNQCSSRDDSANNMASNALDTNMTLEEPASAPPPVEPLSAASVAGGMAHLRMAFAAEAFPGAMIYSQNCYDALSRQFSWARLDQCGGFDMLAVRSMNDADTGDLTDEVGYFESEAAATRYLAAATAAGEDASEADNRLAALQAQSGRARLVAPASPPDLAEYDTDLANAAANASSPDPPDPYVNEGRDDSLDTAWLDGAMGRPAAKPGPAE